MDAPGRGAAGRIQQHEELQNMVAHPREAEGLDDEYILLSHAVPELDVETPIAEAPRIGWAQANAQVVADLLSQLGVGASGEDPYSFQRLILLPGHRTPPW